jgi:hypothetical protein
MLARTDNLEPFLAERIQYIALRSPSFQGAWDMIRSSGRTGLLTLLSSYFGPSVGE